MCVGAVGLIGAPGIRHHRLSPFWRPTEAQSQSYNQSVQRGEIERRLLDFFAADDRRAAAVYLFGSVAKDAAGPDSDIDIGVLYRTPPPPTLDAGPLDLEAALERHLQHHVEVVVLNHAPVDLRARVLRDGRLVVDRDRSARIQFEVRTRNEAFDFEPVLHEYRAPRGRRS